jgi:hypothetical protein
MREPTEAEIAGTLTSLASQSLAGKPVGTVAMVDDVVGVKKMGFMWMVKVFGWKVAIKSKITDWRAGEAR